MVHPVYAHICMRMRIIYVECKNKENKIFTSGINVIYWYCLCTYHNKPHKCAFPVVYVFKSFVFRKCSNDNNGSIGTGCRLFQAGIKIHECRWSLWNCSTNHGTDHRMQMIENDNVPEGSEWYDEFGLVLLFVVVQASNTGISCVVDCATFEFNSSQVVESVEFVTHFL